MLRDPLGDEVEVVNGEEVTKYKFEVYNIGFERDQYDDYQDKPCTVHLDYWPVCGVDGETYPNLSSIGCKGVEVECEGDCPCDDAGSGNDENGSLIQFLPTQPPPPSWGPQL